MASEEDINAVKNSLRAFKGHVTRHMKNVEFLLLMFRAHPGQSASGYMLKLLNSSLEKLNIQHDKYEEQIMNSYNCLDQQSLATIEKELKKTSAKIRKLVQEVESLNIILTAASTSSSAPSASSGLARINQALKPDRLLASCNLAEFSAWRKKYEKAI